MYYFWDIWKLYHKITFDGENKLVIINQNEFNIDIKVDVYSAWKEWIRVEDNSKFLPAFRSIGGDPVGGGLYAGDIYFLTNDWQIVVNHLVNISGIIYNDNQQVSPYIINSGGGVIASVSSLAYAYNTTGASVTLSDIENSPMIAKQETLNNVYKATKLATALSA